MKRAPELQMVCGHAQMAADKQKGQCTAAKGCQSCKWSDWHTHPMDGSQDWHTHTHTQSWKNSQDWHTHPGLAFAAGVYKWLRTSEKGNARLQKGAGAANGLQICCGHAKMAAGKPAKTS